MVEFSSPPSHSHSHSYSHQATLSFLGSGGSLEVLKGTVGGSTTNQKDGIKANTEAGAGAGRGGIAGGLGVDFGGGITGLDTSVKLR
jgi:hypothetical protein